jgi:hypothetical protein
VWLPSRTVAWRSCPGRRQVTPRHLTRTVAPRSPCVHARPAPRRPAAAGAYVAAAPGVIPVAPVMGPPGQTLVVVEQTTYFGSQPVQCVCPNCRAQVVTNVVRGGERGCSLAWPAPTRCAPRRVGRSCGWRPSGQGAAACCAATYRAPAHGQAARAAPALHEHLAAAAAGTAVAAAWPPHLCVSPPRLPSNAPAPAGVHARRDGLAGVRAFVRRWGVALRAHSVLRDWLSGRVTLLPELWRARSQAGRNGLIFFCEPAPSVPAATPRLRQRRLLGSEQHARLHVLTAAQHIHRYQSTRARSAPAAHEAAGARFEMHDETTRRHMQAVAFVWRGSVGFKRRQ